MLTPPANLIQGKLVLYPSEILRFTCNEVLSFDGMLHHLVNDLALELIKHRALGIAAPQIGAPYRVFLFLYQDQIHHVVNPTLKVGDGMEAGYEACLSVPRMAGMVMRHKRAYLSGMNMHGRPVEYDLTGLEARVVQHEYDHLDGILFIDKMVPGTVRTMRNGGTDAQVL
ncbi:MAG: peptide deformylase [Armatimonadota bacterium]|nr:MAG: peptide deformylase [Armatimonadota bacterium]